MDMSDIQRLIKEWEERIDAVAGINMGGPGASNLQSTFTEARMRIEQARAQQIRALQEPAFVPPAPPRQLIVHQRKNAYNMKVEIIIELTGGDGPEYVRVPLGQDVYRIPVYTAEQLSLEPPRTVIIFDLPEDYDPHIRPRENVEAEKGTTDSDLRKFYKRMGRR